VILRALAIAALVGSSACSNTCTPMFGGTGGGFGSFGLQRGDTGKPASVEMQTLLNGTSCGTSPRATRVDVAVTGPDSLRVPSTATMPSAPSGGNEISSTVTFTPMVPGPYHVTARFEPSLGSVQQDVLAVVDKTGTMPMTIKLPSGVHCDQIDFDGDRLICLDTLAGLLRTLRDGLQLDAVRAGAFALSDGKVWVRAIDDGSLSLYTLGADGKLTSLGWVDIGGSTEPNIIARSDRALVVDTGYFVELHQLDGGGIAASTPTELNGGFGAQWLPDAGVVIQQSSEVCSFPAGGDGGCSPSNESEEGYDDDGVWWADFTTGSTLLTLQVTAFKPGLGLVSGLLNQLPSDSLSNNVLQYGPESPPLLRPSTNGNVEAAQLLIPRFDGRDVFLEHYPVIAGDVHADSKRLWSQENDTLTWYPR